MFVGAAVAGSLADRFGRKAMFQATMRHLQRRHRPLRARRRPRAPCSDSRIPRRASASAESCQSRRTLVSEFSPARRRGTMIVLLESFWAYGWVLAALIGYLVIPSYGWRVAFLLGALPALYVLVLRRGIPESPRFLLSQGRVCGGRSSRSARSTPAARSAGASIAEAAGVAAALDLAGERVGDQLWGPPYVRRTVMLWMLWFGIVYSYYGVFTWLPSLLSAGARTPHQVVRVRAHHHARPDSRATSAPPTWSSAWAESGRWSSYLLACASARSSSGAQVTGDGQILFWGSMHLVLQPRRLGSRLHLHARAVPDPRARHRRRHRRRPSAASAASSARTSSDCCCRPGRRTKDSIFVMFAVVFLAIAVVVAVLGEETKGGALEEIAR